MLETSLLYRSWCAKLPDLSGDPGLVHLFSLLREKIAEQSKLIVGILPEYTPHDSTRHLEHLFPLADRVLGADLLGRLNAAELTLLVFSLYAHDWGMAVSDHERDAISGLCPDQDAELIPEEAQSFQRFRDEEARLGRSAEQIWEDYLRRTHAQRSGYRLRRELSSLGQSFAEMVGRISEGHVLDIREIRDPERYPLHTAIFGQVTSVAAVATYVRLVDLLDLAEDRTPFALWSIIRPRNEISRREWKKHRALTPVAVLDRGSIREIVVSGTTNESDIYAALADLQAWVNSQFADSVGFLRHVGDRYDPKLDSVVRWEIQAIGFEPVLLKFDFDRCAALELLSSEVYGGKRLTFVRELLQNSVDALDTRVALLRQSDAELQGRISISVTTLPEFVRIEWTDNGVGMDRYILENYFTRIGVSWYRSPDFLRHSLGQDPISRFGVGLLSCFAASPRLTVTTRRDPMVAKEGHGWHVSIPSRDGHFRVRPDDRVPVGTTIVLDIPKFGSTLTAAAIAQRIRQIAALIKYKTKVWLRRSIRLPKMTIGGFHFSASVL